MRIIEVYIVNSAGGRIFSANFTPSDGPGSGQTQRYTIDRTLSYPLKFSLAERDKRVIVDIDYSEGDGLLVGHSIVAINGRPTAGVCTHEDVSIVDFLKEASNFPVDIRFGHPELSINQKLVFASMFHSFDAISTRFPIPTRICQQANKHGDEDGATSGEEGKKTSRRKECGAKGIVEFETDQFTLLCYQTHSGIKFLVITDSPGQPNNPSANTDVKKLKSAFMRKLHELYSDYALKNPAYNISQPIQCNVFRKNLSDTVMLWNNHSDVQLSSYTIT